MTRIKALGFLVGLPFLAWLGHHLVSLPSHRPETLHDHIGKGCELCAFDGRAEVLLYGLKDVRGIAASPDSKDQDGKVVDGKVFIIQDQLPPIVFDPEKSKAYFSSATCIEADCDVRDAKGVVITDGESHPVKSAASQDAPLTIRLLIAEKGQLMEATQMKDETISLETQISKEIYPPLPPPIGLTQSSSTIFLTTDSPTETKLDEHHPPSGSLVSLPIPCSPAAIKPLTLAKDLARPSGVAATAEHGPVYIAEDRTDRVVWSVYDYNEPSKTWRRSGELAAVPKDADAAPAFRPLALGQDLAHGKRSVIFAAGPEGLYAFRTDGTLLGIVRLDEPIAAMALANHHAQNVIYLVLGGKLCRIRLNPALQPMPHQDPEPCPSNTHPPQPTPPHPKPSQRPTDVKCVCSLAKPS